VHRTRIGSLLVGLQFGLIAALLAPVAGVLLSGGTPGWSWSWVLMLLGLALGAWALFSNRPGNFNIRPTPRVGGQLVQSGPYRWVRHPMYSAVLLVAAASAWVGASPWAALQLSLLAAVLVAKATLEERWMLAEHPGYAEYRLRSWRFVPGLF